jgi:hypothetical protein
MPKKVLAIYYSQTGQLGEILDSFTAPLIGAGAQVEKIRIRPATDYPFPWTGKGFFSVMPDCVMSVPAPLLPFEWKESHYDLVILGYQAWFLSPSIPSNSLLGHAGFRALLKDTPVITITGARNMWLNAFERVRTSLEQAGAKLVGSIALVDKHPNPISFVTIFHWMLHGKKDRYLNIFPTPGVAAADISHTATFGAVVLPYLEKNDYSGMQQELVRRNAVAWKYRFMLVESKARIIFAAWARIIVKKKNRTAWLVAFKYYLLIALFVGAPILITLDAIFVKPFSSRRIKAKKQYFLELN